MRKPYKPEWRILALAGILFVSGLAFFVLRASESAHREPIVDAEIQENEATLPALKNFPPPSSFETFTYESGMQALHVEGTCNDTYFAILIFAEETDYRESPADARYNSAFRCIEGRFSEEIPLAGLPLKESGRYYVIHASQGERGIWHDAY
jgi:hypothetical protein